MSEKRANLELCGCCLPAAPTTPLKIDNRPGLTAIAYRLGTFASFRQSMLHAIASEPALAELTSRESDDSTITLIELWAAVADVLTFYQERIANEAYLRTALHRDSVLRLARMIDYRLRPGLAATTHLAFTVEEAKTVRIPVGLRVMSVPGQDETPQTFETLEKFTADARLNRVAVLPKPKKGCNPMAQGRQALFLRPDNDGWLAAKELSAGERVVLYGGWDTASTVPSCGSLSQISGSGVPYLITTAASRDWRARILMNTRIFWDSSRRPSVSFRTAPTPQAADAPEEKEIREIGVDGDRFLLVFRRPIAKSGWTRATKAGVFTRKMRLFGHNAPAKYATFTTTVVNATTRETRVDWKSHSVPAAALQVKGNELPLDAVYSDLTAGTQLLVYNPSPAIGDPTVFVATVNSVRDENRVLVDNLPQNSLADPRFQATVTIASVTTDLDKDLDIANLRKVIVYQLKGPEIPLWTSDFDELIQIGKSGDLYVPATRLDHLGGEPSEVESVEIGRTVEGMELKPGAAIRLDEIGLGRLVLLSDNTVWPIVATISDVRLEEVEEVDFLVLRVESASDIQLRAATATLLGNVARASHGETVDDEILGNGDATEPFQSFHLQKSPLTYIPSKSSAGGESTLQVVVNGEEWTQRPTLFGETETSRVYVARQNDDGTTEVQFGDASMGARLPTGLANVVGGYRKGSGLEGRLEADQLSILLDQLVGLKSVTNPAATEGGADPETLDTARETAPTTVKTFGRAVSLLDFESLIQASGEVARAKATWVWQGFQKAVHLTVAGQQGQLFSAEKLLALHDGLTTQRDPNHLLLLGNLCRVPVVVRAKLQLDPKLEPEIVVQAARSAVLEFFDFEKMPFARTLHLSDIYQVLQSVEGVLALHVSEFHFKGHATSDFTARGATADPVQQHLRILAARPRDDTRPGSNLTFCPDGDKSAVIPAEQAYFEDESTDLELTPGVLENG